MAVLLGFVRFIETENCKYDDICKRREIPLDEIGAIEDILTVSIIIGFLSARYCRNDGLRMEKG